MATVRMTAGDTGPDLTATLYEDTALTTPVDLTGATVVLWIRKADGTVLVDDAACTITDDTGGAVSYDWSTAVSAAGAFVGRFKVTFGGGAVVHFPNFEDIRFIFIDDKSI